MDFSVVLDNLPFLIAGIRGTLLLAVGALIVGVVAGLLVGVGRLSRRRPVAVVAGLYVDFMRSVPLLVLLVFYVYAVPILIENATGRRILIEPLFAAITGLGLYEAAYFAEVFRTGILAVPSGQREAALSSGMTPTQAMRRVVLPQAVRLMIPPTASLFATLTKDTSIAFAVAVEELMAKAASLVAYTFRPVEVLIVVAVIYLLLLYPMTLAAGYLERRVTRYA
jgi:His/Glu/Gln/Arg/opine family amino acid ABC transporter permease subunit